MSASPYALVALAAARDADRYGAKAANLARAAAAGLPVPPGFVLPDGQFQRFLDDNGLREPIAAILRTLDPGELAAVREAARSIRGRVLDSSLPPVLRAALGEVRDALGSGARLIVRSSAAGEDSPGASFAGQLDTIPGAVSQDELERALRACWASYWSERALAYQARRGVRLAGMGVIVQREIDARLSGVLFSRSPDDPDDMLLEFCPGQGEALVSGRVDPGRIAVSRATLSVRVLAAAELLPDPADVRALARAACALESEFGCAQDIEWCVARDGQRWILQSRPITTRPSAARAFWSNANIAENFPGPVSPLLYSIAAEGYRCYFRHLAVAFGIPSARIRAMDRPLRQIIGAHGARLYYNLTNIHAVIRHAPFGNALARAFDQFVTAPAGPHARATRTGLRDFAALPWVAAKTTWQYLFLPRRVAAFEREASAFAARTPPEALRTRTLAALADDFRGFLEIRFHRWTNAALADAAAMVCYGCLRSALQRFAPQASAALPIDLLKGLPGVVSSLPVVRLWELSRLVRDDPQLDRLFEAEASGRILARLRERRELASFRERFDAFLDDWGFRCPGELMLTVPSLQETPEAVIDLLKTYRRLESDSPLQAVERQAADRARTTERLLAALPAPRAWALRLLLHCTHGAIRLRERARLKQALLYSRARRIALEIGERLAARGLLAVSADAFCFTYQELLELASGAALHPHHAREVVALRRRAEEEGAQNEPPDAFTLAEGEYLSPGATGSGDAPSGLAGTSACAGVARGRAAVLSDLSQAPSLAAGDVLVARQTDPGWGPVFFLLKGLVLERGGMLSHGAILAREYGIPTVVGVPEATRRIPHGAEVTVDGDRGVVELVA